jgi:gliding motility-associatede transport system auxiliary component
MEKLKKWSFWIATIFILGAIATRFEKPDWRIYCNIAIGIGVFFFLISLYNERESLRSFFSARSTKYGLNSVAMILLTLAFVGVANWVFSRHAIKYDATKNKAFSLSSLTINALRNLKQPVKIIAFYTYADDDAGRNKMKTLLEDYGKHSKMLDAKVVDPMRNLPLVRQYGVDRNGTTVIESGGQKTTVTSTNEEDLTNAILKVSSSKHVTLYFLQGHKEPSISDAEGGGFSAVVDELKKSNYEVKELGDLAAKAKIPNDCTALIVGSPSVALLDHEVKAIVDYLNSGGRALILDDPRADASLEKVITAFNVKGANDIIVDNDCNFPLAGPVVPCVVPKLGTPVAREFDNRAVMFFPEAKSLSYSEQADTKASFTVVAESSDKSWGETDKERANFDEGKDIKGPLTTGLLITKPVEKGMQSNETKIAIFGDLSFTQNQFVNWSPWNYRLFSNTIAWLTEQENLIHLPPKNAQTDTMMLSSTQMNYILLLVVIGMPVIVLGTGIAVWMRRKKL